MRPGVSWRCDLVRAAAAASLPRRRVPQDKRRADARRLRLKNGAGEENRTADPRITNALLYQLS